MPVKKSIFSALLLVPVFVFGQASNNSFLAPLASESLLLDIAHHNGHFVAVGERGHILRSQDAKQWQQLEVPTLATLTAVDFEQNHAWAVGHDATIVTSQDGGLTWQLQYQAPELEKPLLDVLFFDENHGIAIGAYGLFLRSKDGGKHWEKEMHPELLNPDDIEYMDELKQEDEDFYLQELQSILPNLNRVSFDGSKLYLAGEKGLLASSDDLGLTWQRMEIDYIGSFFDIQLTASGRLLAAGLRGNVFEWQDEQWLAIESGTSFTFNSIVSVDGNTTLILGNNGAILRLTGTKVDFKQTDDNKALISAVVSANSVIAVSEVGVKTWASEGQHE
ncbi:YCF48-related protein [Paraglaciecola hydrolytica]|uniref:Photosynthesis system II assembly factor Ycf48/Hcf136-like domain-containing protein n=1 Tax=Paraglaciecola hydrolytica TaxID=1799789 RepID=A0A136A2M1_9ALTE|nr:YCF48-related protein [Paraglaciecola hydrolytica]KXI29475.1 hypothetical protein AX660_12870 [Paraglaciecola hydrolytica]